MITSICLLLLVSVVTPSLGQNNDFNRTVFGHIGQRHLVSAWYGNAEIIDTRLGIKEHISLPKRFTPSFILCLSIHNYTSEDESEFNPNDEESTFTTSASTTPTTSITTVASTTTTASTTEDNNGSGSGDFSGAGYNTSSSTPSISSTSTTITTTASTSTTATTSTVSTTTETPGVLMNRTCHICGYRTRSNVNKTNDYERMCQVWQVHNKSVLAVKPKWFNGYVSQIESDGRRDQVIEDVPNKAFFLHVYRKGHHIVKRVSTGRREHITRIFRTDQDVLFRRMMIAYGYFWMVLGYTNNSVSCPTELRTKTMLIRTCLTEEGFDPSNETNTMVSSSSVGIELECTNPGDQELGLEFGGRLVDASEISSQDNDFYTLMTSIRPRIFVCRYFLGEASRIIDDPNHMRDFNAPGQQQMFEDVADQEIFGQCSASSFDKPQRVFNMLKVQQPFKFVFFPNKNYTTLTTVYERHADLTGYPKMINARDPQLMVINGSAIFMGPVSLDAQVEPPRWRWGANEKDVVSGCDIKSSIIFNQQICVGCKAPMLTYACLPQNNSNSSIPALFDPNNTRWWPDIETHIIPRPVEPPHIKLDDSPYLVRRNNTNIWNQTTLDRINTYLETNKDQLSDLKQEMPQDPKHPYMIYCDVPEVTDPTTDKIGNFWRTQAIVFNECFNRGGEVRVVYELDDDVPDTMISFGGIPLGKSKDKHENTRWCYNTTNNQPLAPGTVPEPECNSKDDLSTFEETNSGICLYNQLICVRFHDQNDCRYPDMGFKESPLAKLQSDSFTACDGQVNTETYTIRPAYFNVSSGEIWFFDHETEAGESCISQPRLYASQEWGCTTNHGRDTIVAQYGHQAHKEQHPCAGNTTNTRYVESECQDRMRVRRRTHPAVCYHIMKACKWIIDSDNHCYSTVTDSDQVRKQALSYNQCLGENGYGVDMPWAWRTDDADTSHIDSYLWVNYNYTVTLENVAGERCLSAPVQQLNGEWICDGKPVVHLGKTVTNQLCMGPTYASLHVGQTRLSGIGSGTCVNYHNQPEMTHAPYCATRIKGCVMPRNPICYNTFPYSPLQANEFNKCSQKTKPVHYAPPVFKERSQWYLPVVANQTAIEKLLPCLGHPTIVRNLVVCNTTAGLSVRAPYNHAVNGLVCKELFLSSKQYTRCTLQYPPANSTTVTATSKQITHDPYCVTRNLACRYSD